MDIRRFPCTPRTVRMLSMIGAPRLTAAAAGWNRQRIWLMLAAGCLAASQAGPAAANPLGATVVSGQASFAQQGNQLTVTNSPHAIIHWNSFSIEVGELTRFVQQSSTSTVLNRITGQDPSLILGALQSNGHVYLLNPNGILFGAGAQVNVGGMVASTLSISNDDFLAGRQRFAAGPVAGAISNLGAITTPSGGQVVLIAPEVSNAGIITSPQGEVILAAGRSVQLADTSNPELQVVISASGDQAVNLGQVIAEGGRIGIYGAMIQQRGRLSADSAVVGENGRIVLKSSRATLLEAGSLTSATGAGRGGEIQVLGPQVALTGNARVDASGNTGGGSVLVGGSYRRSDASVMTATQTLVDCDSSVAADARIHGNGGTVVVWGERTAQVYGSLSVRGGAQSGNGGRIETSGNWLDTFGMKIDASAPNGSKGSWLLDPYDIFVGIRGVAIPVNGIRFADASASGNQTMVLASQLSAATADIVLEATHDLTFNNEVNIAATGVSLTGRAGNDIILNAALTTNGGNIVLAANDSGGGASGVGAIRNSGNYAVSAGSGKVTMTDVNSLPSVSVCVRTPTLSGCETVLQQGATIGSPTLSVLSTTTNLNSPLSTSPVNIITKGTTVAPASTLPTSSATPTSDDATPLPTPSTSSSKTESTANDSATSDKKDKNDTIQVTTPTAKATSNEPVKKTYCN